MKALLHLSCKKNIIGFGCQCGTRLTFSTWRTSSSSDAPVWASEILPCLLGRLFVGFIWKKNDPSTAESYREVSPKSNARCQVHVGLEWATHWPLGKAFTIMPRSYIACFKFWGVMLIRDPEASYLSMEMSRVNNAEVARTWCKKNTKTNRQKWAWCLLSVFLWRYVLVGVEYGVIFANGWPISEKMTRELKQLMRGHFFCFRRCFCIPPLSP